jgi:hypothetical protein
MNPYITASDLRRAATLKDKIQELQNVLSNLLGIEVGNGVRRSNMKPMRRGRRKMSADAKAKIAASSRARWAKVKAPGKRKL